jgi:RNA polymerase sigma factor (sigma-70 family)
MRDADMGFPSRQASVQSLVKEHYEGLYRYAYRLSGQATDAEDLVQETFCKAQEKLGQLREPERAKAWLFSILRNNYLHRLRAAQHPRMLTLEEIHDFPEPAENLPEVEPEKLQQALNELPELFRTPIIMYYFEEFSYRDIAEQMEVPIGTVMSRLARAKAFLRDRLFPPTPVSAQGRGSASHGL